MRSSSLAFIGLSLGFLLACGGGEKPAETTTTTPPPPPPPTEPATGTAGGIGVAECDDYFKKVDDCLGKLDATSKAAFETSQKTMKDQWTAAAATPEGKAALSTGCKAALDAFTCPAVGAGDATGTGTDATKDATKNDAHNEQHQGRTAPARGSGDAEGRRERPSGGSGGSGNDGAEGRRTRPQ